MSYAIKKKIREYKSTLLETTTKDIVWNYDISLDSVLFQNKYINTKNLIQELHPELIHLQTSSQDLSSDVTQSQEKQDYFTIISHLIKDETIDSDWFTGIFLAHEILSLLTFNVLSFNFKSWHSGYDTNLINGFKYFILRSKFCRLKKIAWEWKGMDIKSKNNPESIHGFINNNITSLNNLHNITNIIKENYLNGVDCIIHDISPNPTITYSGILSSILFLKKNGAFVLRIPNPDSWDIKYQHMSLLCSMIFEKVYIWKPLWDNKYYLICHKKKATIYSNKINPLLNLLDNIQTYAIFNESVFIPEVVEWLFILNNIKTELIENNVETSNKADQIQDWLGFLVDELT